MCKSNQFVQGWGSVSKVSWVYFGSLKREVLRFWKCELSFINVQNNHNVNDQILLNHPPQSFAAIHCDFYALKAHFMCIQP